VCQIYKNLKRYFPQHITLTRRKAGADHVTTICSAISSKCLIDFHYHGGFHLVEPYCLGKLTPVDGDSLWCYQVSGYSEFGDLAGWKLFRVAEIASLEITGEYFAATRPEYNPDIFNWSVIHCCISADRNELKLAEIRRPDPENKPKGITTNMVITARALTHNELMRRFRLAHLVFPWKKKP